jgi:YVTN family beta-propeller protein
VINGGTNKVIKTLYVGKSPEGIAVDPIKGTIFVANSGSYRVSVLEGSAEYFQVLAKVDLVSENFTNLPQVYNLATYIAVNPETNKVYVTNEDADVVSVLKIDYSTLKNFESVTPANQHMILVTGRISPSQIRQPGTTPPGILVGVAPHGIALDYTTDLIYVTNQESDSILVLEGTTRSVLYRNIPVGLFLML